MGRIAPQSEKRALTWQIYKGVSAVYLIEEENK